MSRERMALEGLRMLDFTRAQAGPLCTALLADMGMEVIKVETAKQHDFMRALPPHPPGDDGWNSPYYGVWSRGKKSVTLDVSHAKGLELAKRLVQVCDVVVDNFAPGVMGKLGLGYPALKEVKADIVAASLTGFGTTGPYQKYVAFAKPIQAYMGLVDQTGYAGGPPMEPACAFGDNVGGTYAAFAIMAALHYRKRTGKGQYIEASMLEAMLCTMPEPVLRYVMNKTLRPRDGNRDDVMSPHDTYPCQGDDAWVAIAVSNDQEWQALRRVTGVPERDRWRERDEIDMLIGQWTSRHGKYQAAALLQEAGVIASPVLNTKDMLEDPHLRAREYFVAVDDPRIGKWPVGGPSWKMSATPGRVRRYPPAEGEDNEYVYRELLGLPAEEIESLIENKIIH